ncbi:MAG: SDR family oxidoreductase [Desemzia incerta]|uniref:NAD(P)H dehydrogenase (Quinone) n=1 Tax=Desemzia incerta TaxID=82801 RepID=A0A1I5XK77_9LACT|nr:SDR family oxidoreductase [Desemzia incerta]WHZ33052.1 SDR family oxidoreductase [Desemzia incerta]SFQ32393.1 NAD(P)H dehydrogenase (quinone) [Desemzia incerta]
MKILITGATGMLGVKVVQALLERVPTEQLAVSVRDLAKAERFKEQRIEIRQADYEDPASLEAAFTGIDRLLLISSQGDDETRIRQHSNVIYAAERTGVGLLVYTSVSKAETSSLPVAEVHRQTEAAIIKSGIPYTFLRNNWYVENEIPVIKNVLAGGPVLTAAESGRVGWVPRVDYAEAAAAVLASGKHTNKIYELSGIPSSYADMARELTSILGRRVIVRNVDDKTYQEVLIANGTPDVMAEFSLDIQRAIRKGDLDVESADLPYLMGRPAISLKQSLTEIVYYLNTVE